MVKASYVPRPGFVISQNTFNHRTSFAWVCPITNQVKGYPFEISLPTGLKTQGVILADQLRSLDFQARQMTFIEVPPPDPDLTHVIHMGPNLDRLLHWRPKDLLKPRKVTPKP